MLHHNIRICAMFIEALFLITRNLKQHKWPSLKNQYWKCCLFTQWNAVLLIKKKAHLVFSSQMNGIKIFHDECCNPDLKKKKKKNGIFSVIRQISQKRQIPLERQDSQWSQSFFMQSCLAVLNVHVEKSIKDL